MYLNRTRQTLHKDHSTIPRKSRVFFWSVGIEIKCKCFSQEIYCKSRANIIKIEIEEK